MTDGSARRVKKRALQPCGRGPKFAPPVVLAPRRPQILDILTREPGLGAGELARRLGLTPQSTGDHLNRLREAGILEGEHRGRSIGWRVAVVVAHR